MATHLCPYSGFPDHPAMLHLACTCQAGTLHVIDLPYRLSSWALDEPGNVGLWVDETGQLAAWAVLQTPFWTVDFVIKPDLEPQLLPQILSWVDQQAQVSLHTSYGRPSWYVNLFADQVERRHILEQAGYACQSSSDESSWRKVWMKRSASSHVPDYPLPKGFTLRLLEGESEVPAYVALHQAVFESRNMTVEWRQRTLNHPGYAPDLDLVVAAPGGQLAAFSIGWLSTGLNGELQGQIEPLGCHVDYRSYALGRIVLCEVIRRMHAQGAQVIFVETDSYRNTAFRLYESVGFEVLRDVLVYRKDYNDPAG